MKKALFAPFAALIVMLLAGPAPGHAAPPEQSLHSNYDHDLLEVYFKRAENVRDEAEWREMVDQGIDVVKGRWESAALLAAGDPDLVAEERALLDGELETEKNERLTSFLLDKFFRQLSGAEIESVLQAVEEANKLYLYQKDEEGNIKIDAAGDPMLYERVNCDTGAEFEEDDAAWRDAVAARIARVASAWDANAESIWDALPVDHPELLAALGGESGRFSLSLAACRQGLVNEFERIRTQEERIFREKRLSDQYSLRKKTDEEAAAETADRLIAEAREEGEAGIRRVRDGLERLDLRISVGNVDVSSRDWLSSFEREFDKGLDVWESAEREFLRRRSEWEKEAGIRFEAAEKEWAGAYRRLLDARAAWEAGLMREKERGLRLWREKEDKLAVSLREASEKLEQAIGERTGGVGMQISALFDMYLQADTVLVTADNSIEFWRDDLSDLIAEYNDSETAKTEGRIDPARLEEAFRNRDTAALTALAGELAAKLTAVQAAVRERKTEFDEALCPLLSRYDDAHRDDPHQTLTVSFPYGDERFMNYVNSSGGGGWNLSEEKCRAYFAQHIESFLTIDGQSILTVIDRMADFNDPRLKDDADGSRTDITLTCSFRMQGGSEFHFDTIVHCWTEEWRAAASQYLAGEIEHFGDRAADALNAAQELSFWFEQQATYQTYRQQAAQSLADTYGLALGDADAAERDAVNGDWSSLLLDCFQRELLIAKGESAYWQKQVTIARAVADYAHDTSSGRPTEAETQARYDAALAEFTQAETDYQAAVAELTRLGEDVATTRAEYEQAKAVWDRARTALEQKQAVYQQKMGVLMNMGDEYYRNGIQARYDELLVDFGLKSRENTPTLAGTMADYYAALARYGGEQRAAAGARELSALVNGSAQAGLPSLDDLKRRVSDYGAILTYDQTTGAAHIDESRMAAGAPGLDDLTAATAAYNLLLGDSDADPADLRMARLTLDGMAASLAGGATEAYRNRIEAMSLLAAGSYAQWTAAAETGLSPDEMRTQAESSGIVYLRDKALLLGSVFDKIASGVYTKVVLAGKDDLSGEERLALACLLAFDGDEVDALRESLAKIARIFPSSSPGPLDSYRDAITSLTSMDEAARAFFASGGNIFGGVDFADLFAPQSARDRDRALTRAALLDRYAGLAQCLSADAGARAVDGLAEYLSANGLGGRSDAGFALSNPESVWRAAVAGGPADRRTVLSALKRYQDGLAEIGPGLPAWMYEGVAGYLDRLADYFTLKLVMAEKPADTNDLAVVTEWHREQKTKLDAESAALKTGQAAFDRRTADLRAFESALADRNLAPLSKLVSIYKALGGCGEAILEDDAADLLVRHSLSAAEAREELVNLAAVTLASRAYGQNGSDPETVLASSADLGLGDLLSRDAALKTSILERAASLLAGARSLDQSLDSLDFTGASGPEARYALWRRCAPEEVRAEVSGADADAIRAELAAESQDLEKLRLMLSLGSLEAVAGIKGEGKTYSRALYLGLADAGFDGAELASAWTLLCDAYGIADRDTAAFLGAFAAGGADETGQALFCYEGSQYGKAYYLKGLVLSGESAYPYLDDSVRADIEEFQRQLDLLKNYLPGIDGDKFDYAAPAGGNALAAGKAGALLELGIDDPFFAQFEGSTGGAWLDFLSIHAEGAARNVSELMLERGTIEDRANADAAKDHARTLAHVTRERDLIARWLSADETAVTRGGLEYTAKYGFNFRSALEADKLAVDNGDPLPALDTEALAEDASSPGGLYYYDSWTDKSGYRNEELDQYNGLLAGGRILSDALNRPAATDAAREKFLSAVAPLSVFFDADPDNDRLDGSLNDLLDAIQPDDEAMRTADNARYGMERRIALLKTETAGAAEAFAAVKTQKDAYEAEVINPLRAELRGLQAETDAAAAALDAAKAPFLAADAACQAQQTALKAKYDELENKRLDLQTREEILEYAKSIYLKPEGGEETLAVDPDAKLAKVRFESEKADAVYRTLEALFGADERRRSILETNPELKTAFEDYGDSYRAFLRMKEAQRLIEDAVRIQSGNVDQARREAYEALSGLGNAGGFNLLSTEMKEGDEQGAYEEWREDYGENGDLVYSTAEYWLRYFNLPADSGSGFASWSSGLALDGGFNAAGTLSSCSPESLFPDARTDADLAALKEFQDKADDYVNSERFMKDFEDWAYRLTRRSDYETLMNTWENAYYFLMEEVATGGCIARNGSLYEQVPVYYPQTQPGQPADIVWYYRTQLRQEYTDKLDLIRQLAEPFTEKTHDEDHWYEFGTGRYMESGNYNTNNAPPLENMIIAGQTAFASLQNDADFSFLVFLLKTGVISSSSFEMRETPTGEEWPNAGFTHGYRYRDYKRFDSETLDSIKSKSQAFHDEQSVLALLENGNGRDDAAAVLDAVVRAARLVKPTGFDDSGPDADASLRAYFADAIDRYYEAARADYAAKTGADPKAKMADLAAMLAGEAAVDRARLKTGLDGLLDRLHGAQNGNDEAYRTALSAVGNAKTQEELDAASAELETAAGTALKDCAFQETDALLAYYRLYESIVSEYVSGFTVDGQSPFSPTIAPRGIEVDSAVFTDIRDLMGLQQGALTDLYAARLSACASVQTGEMNLKLAELQGRESDWSEKMDAIIQRGRDEWNAARLKMETARSEWADSFEEEFKAKSDAWNDDYLAFNLDKNAWIAGAEEKLARTGDAGVAEALGTEAEEAVAVSLSRTQSDMSELAVSPGEVAASLLGSSLFERISAYASLLNRGVGHAGTDVNVVLAGKSIADAQVLSNVDSFLADRRQAISEHTAAVTARTAEQAIEQAIEDMQKQVADADKNVDRNVGSMLESAGFTRSGSVYSRSAIIGSSILGGNEYTDQSIGTYVSFTPPRFMSGVDLSPAAARDLDQEGVNALVDRAVRDLRNQLTVVMGDGNGTKGEFQTWVGEQAKLKGESVDPGASIDANLADAGSGELGRIFRLFLDDELKRQKGDAEARAPFYNKPLWGEFLGIEGPSIRSLIDIGLSIITKPLMSIPVVGMFLNSLDDLVFMCADIASGALSAAQAGLEFGKKVVTNIITMGMGAAGGAVGEAFDFGSDAAGVLGKTLLTGAQSFATNAATGVVSSLEFDSSGNLSWNAERYRESVIGRQAVAGYLGGMAGTAMTEGLNGTILGKETKMTVDPKTNRTISVFENFEGMDVRNVRTFTGLAGNALNGLVEYGISGQTTLSLLRINDVGVFELRLGGDRKTLGFGMSGIDMSAGRIAGSIQGVYDMHMNARITDAAANTVEGAASAREKAAKMRLNYSYGDDVAREALYRVLDGTDRLTMDYVPEQFRDAAGRGVTQTDADGTRHMYAYGGGSGDFMTWLSESTTLQHEAYRDGVVDRNNDAETRDAVLAHTGMALRLAQTFGDGFLAGDSNLTRDVIAYSMAQRGMISFDAYAASEYDSSADYWRLTKEGKIVYDGRTDLYDETGKIRLRKATGTNAKGEITFESSFAEFTGMAYGSPEERDAVARRMAEAGFKYDETKAGFDANKPSTWFWHTGAAGTANMKENPGYAADRRLIYGLVKDSKIGRNEAYEMLNAQEALPEKYTVLPWFINPVGTVESVKSLFGYNPVSFEEWNAEVDKVLNERLAAAASFNSQKNQDYLHNLSLSVGDPYWKGAPQIKTVKLEDGNTYDNTEPDLDHNESNGRDCCGLCYSCWRMVGANIAGISEKDVEKYFPIMGTAAIIRKIESGQMPYLEIFTNRSDLQPGDMIVVDIHGKWNDNAGNVKQDFDLTTNEHIMTYAGQEYIKATLASWFDKTFRNISAAKIIQPGSQLITTTGLGGGQYGSPDARLGANDYVGATTFTKYESDLSSSGLSVTYKFIRTDWTKFKEYIRQHYTTR